MRHDLQIKKFLLMFVIFLGNLTFIFSGCATAGAEDRIYHTLQFEVDKSIGKAINIRYTYGEELVDRYVPGRGWVGGPFQSHTAPMRIPEEFKISWETEDGKMHNSNVPVLSKLPYSCLLYTSDAADE